MTFHPCRSRVMHDDALLTNRVDVVFAAAPNASQILFESGTDARWLRTPRSVREMHDDAAGSNGNYVLGAASPDARKRRVDSCCLKHPGSVTRGMKDVEPIDGVHVIRAAAPDATNPDVCVARVLGCPDAIS